MIEGVLLLVLVLSIVMAGEHPCQPVQTNTPKRATLTLPVTPSQQPALSGHASLVTIAGDVATTIRTTESLKKTITHV